MICENPISKGPNRGESARGTRAGYRRHKNVGELPCRDCSEARTRIEVPSRGRRHVGSGLVYFIAEDGWHEPYQSHYVKVGWTNSYDSLDQRLTGLQIGNARTLEVVAVIEYASREAESEMHRLWNRWHVRGEWFAVPAQTLERLGEGRIRGPGGVRVRGWVSVSTNSLLKSLRHPPYDGDERWGA